MKKKADASEGGRNRLHFSANRKWGGVGWGESLKQDMETETDKANTFLWHKSILHQVSLDV